MSFLLVLRRRALPLLDLWGTPAAQLVTRVVFGQAFAVTGFGKLQHLDKVTAFFTELGIPFPQLQAPMIGTIEFVGGILLLLGLGTRAAGLLLISTMLVALATAERTGLAQGVVFAQSFADVAPLPFLVALLWLVTKGAGPLSFDRQIAKRMNAASTSDERGTAHPASIA